MQTLAASLPEQYDDGQHASPGWPGQVSPLLVQTPELQVAEPQPESALDAPQGCPVGRQYAFPHDTHG
jgi:hypothetical protein